MCSVHFCFVRQICLGHPNQRRRAQSITTFQLCRAQLRIPCSNIPQTQNAASCDVHRPGIARVSERKLSDVKLILAPMEVLADHQFRKAIATVDGMHEAVHEFIRITHPKEENVRGVIRNRYFAREMGTIPLAAQIMGGDPEAMAMATAMLANEYGAHRVDLNCGCPAKKVNGRGAGASLLRTPENLYEITRRMVEAASMSKTAVSVKMRSGFESTALFEDNVHAVIQAGASMLTVHPRTKKQAYSGRADWELIRKAKSICGDLVQVVGNGDITRAEHALQMLDYTGCDHVMVGRGAVSNPWIFWEIREAFARRYEELDMSPWSLVQGRVDRDFQAERRFFESYFVANGDVSDKSSPKAHRMKIGRLKMLLGYSSIISDEEKESLLRGDGGGDSRQFLSDVLEVLKKLYDT